MKETFRVFVELKEIKICSDCINVDLCAEFQIRKFDAMKVLREKLEAEIRANFTQSGTDLLTMDYEKAI